MKKHEKWRIVPNTMEQKPIPTKFLFVRKYDENRSVSRYKARMVVKGFFQGFTDHTYRPVIYFTTVRAPIATQRQMLIHQLDIMAAFLHGTIDSTVHIFPPAGLADMCVELRWKNETLQLEKGLYDLKQASVLSNRKWQSVMESIQFVMCCSNSCPYRRRGVWLLFYVDDVILMSALQSEIDAVVDVVGLHLDVKNLGPLKNFLRVVIEVGPSSVFKSQRGYVESLLRRFSMNNCKSVKTPMVL